ncbi:hypothetical protein ASF83_07195 [Plantibacter sp. Leaf171]|nr:hypothetical protein ASF83_07195 [Plantibacter sp. Leaf171]
MELGAVVEDLDLDPGRSCRTGDGGPDGVVEQVPEDGGHVLRIAQRSGDEGLRSDGQEHPAFRGLDPLRAEERLQVRFRESIGVLDGVSQWAVVEHVREVPTGLVVLTGLEQAGDRVQTVRELVPLRAEGGGHRRDGVESAGQRLDVGAVAHDDDPAEVHAVLRHRPDVDEEDPGADDELGRDLSGCVVRHEGDESLGQIELGEGASDGRVDAEQAGRLIGAHRHDPARGDPDDPLADAAEHSGLVLHQGGELLRAEAEGQSPQSAPDEHGRDQADGQRQEGCPRDQRRLPRDVGEDPLRGEPHADLSDDLPGACADDGTRGVRRLGREHGHLGPRGRTEGPGLPRHGLPAGQRRFGARAHLASEFVGIGMRQTDPAFVGDDHEERAGPCTDLGSERLQGGGPQLGGLGRPGGARLEGHGRSDVRVARDALGDRQGRRLGLLHEAFAAHPGVDPGAHHDDGRDHDELEDEDLRREARASGTPPFRPRRSIADHGSDGTALAVTVPKATG